MSPDIYLASLGILFGTVAAIFAMKYFSSAYAARAKIANDKSWSELAEKAVAVQTENQSALSTIRDELANLSASLAAVEKILKQVE